MKDETKAKIRQAMADTETLIDKAVLWSASTGYTSVHLIAVIAASMAAGAWIRGAP